MTIEMRMNMGSCLASFAIGAALLASPSSRAGGQWVICKYKIKVTSINRPDETLTANIMQSTGPVMAGCPVVGQAITFRPETLDYQSTLPHRKWPRPGLTADLVYRQLDGACYNEGGRPGEPCRIRHFSIH